MREDPACDRELYQVHQQVRDEAPGDLQSGWSSCESWSLLLRHYDIYLQADITKFEEDFEKSGDPFSEMDNGNHLNSVAGGLKSYFRKLEEPLFSEAYFDQLMNITRETRVLITNYF